MHYCGSEVNAALETEAVHVLGCGAPESPLNGGNKVLQERRKRGI